MRNLSHAQDLSAQSFANQMPVPPQMTLFRGSLQTLDVAWPLVFFLFAVGQAIWSWSFTPNESQLIEFIAATVGLNLLHTGLSYVLLFKVPEVQLWVAATTHGRPHRFWLFCTAIFLGTMAMALAATKAFPSSQGLIVSALVISWFLGAHHGVAQNLGLGQLVIRRLRSLISPSDLIKLERHLGFERFARKALIAGLFIFAVGARVGSNFLQPLLGGGAVPVSIFKVGVALSYLAIVAIVLNTLMMPRAIRTEKLRINSKLLLFGAPVNFLAAIGSNFAHGYEYLGIYTQMVKNSRMGKPQRRSLIYAVAFVVISILLVTIFKNNGGLIRLILQPKTFDEVPLWVKILNALSAAISFTHYYIDSQLFKMRNPEVRRHIAPLLRAD